MYFAIVILLMGVLPVASILAEWGFAHGGPDFVSLIGKWFVFWSVGVRLMLAGGRQIFNPTFTAEAIFGVKEKAALTIVQELGFGNLSIGLLGLLSLANPLWTVPAAIAGGLFYGLAGIKHLTNGERNAIENVAMISDLFIFVVLALYLAAVALRPA
jgi:hypothetical protein